MPQLTAALERAYELGDITAHGVKQSATIYTGSAVGLTAGFARQLTAGDQFLGFATDDVAGPAADGGATVRVRYRGQVVLPITGVAVTDIGKPVYASDGDTFTLTESTNTAIGRVARVNGTNSAVVAFDATRAGLGDFVSLTDSSGGTAGDTIIAVPAAYSQADFRSIVASLTDRINRIGRFLG